MSFLKPGLVLAFFMFSGISLHAYETSVTKLADENYDPFPADGIQTGILEGRKWDLDEKDLAVMTLSFAQEEIGQDYQAATLLAQKEAGKIGGTRIYYVSSTEYTKTKEIGSTTYRVSRNEADVKALKEREEFQKTLKLEKQRSDEKERWKIDIQATEFGKAYEAYLNDLSTDGEAAMKKKMGIADKRITLKSGRKKNISIDALTGNKLSESDIDKRITTYLKISFDEFKKIHKDAYLQNYVVLRQIDSRYLAEDSGLNLQGWPDSSQYDNWYFFDTNQKFLNFIPSTSTITDMPNQSSRVVPYRAGHEPGVQHSSAGDLN